MVCMPAAALYAAILIPSVIITIVACILIHKAFKG